jgi:tetratricopeptide (TPR) repeat protein
MPEMGENRLSQRVRGGRDVNASGRDQTVINAGDHTVVNIREAATAGSKAARPVLAGDVPQQPPGFQPRAGLLEALDASGPGVSVVHAVTGQRGVGKTQLAAAYARNKLAEGWRLVAWVNAQDAASLAAGLAVAAEAAELAPSPGEDPGMAVRHWLEAGGDQCLIVFDNATDADVLRPYLPAGGAARVLVTSNRRSVAELGDPVGVEVFTPDEAIAFLAGRTGLADPAEARSVAEELGFLPLGLAQAAAVIRAQHLGYGTYLQRLRELPVAGYLTRQNGQPYPHGVAEVVLLSLAAIQDVDRTGTCTGVMALLSVLSAAGVRRDLLYAAGQLGALGERGLGAAVVDEALGRLAEWSLLSFTLGGQVVAAHRLVLRVVREHLAQQGRLTAVCRAAASTLNAHATILVGSQDHLAVRNVPEQVAALQQATAKLPEGTGDLEAALLDLRFWAQYHLNGLGDSAEQAIAVGEPLVEDYERLVGDHPSTLAARNNLAAAYRTAGRTSEVIPLLERTLADLERLLGPDHPDTLGSRNNLALAYQDAGLIAEAILLHERTLSDRERLLGPDHPETLASRNNLGNAYRTAGRAAEAMVLHERTLSDRERLLGPDHPETLNSRNNLGNAYRTAGRPTGAIPLLERTPADYERLLGPDHPITLASRNNLAAAYLDSDAVDKAIALHERTVADRERLLGPDHPDTLGSRNNLGNAYRTAGRVAEAIALHERTVADMERLLGPDHPSTLISRSNLALAYQGASRAVHAPPRRRGWSLRRRSAPQHPDS